MATGETWSDDFSHAPDEISPSPNVDARAGGADPDLVVLHYTGMRDAAEALERLRDPAAKVSAHYLIGPDGRLWGLAPERARAWHAGVSSWEGVADVNSRSIGIELANPGHLWDGSPEGYAPFPEPQMARLEQLLAAILARWAIRPARVLAHSDVAPGRKIDPGEKFDWARLARRGLAAPTPDAASGGASLETAAFRSDLRAYGYGDWSDAALLDALRRRFRPWALDRPFEAADAAIARRLASGPA